MAVMRILPGRPQPMRPCFSGHASRSAAVHVRAGRAAPGPRAAIRIPALPPSLTLFLAARFTVVRAAPEHGREPSQGGEEQQGRLIPERAEGISRGGASSVRACGEARP